MGKRLVSQPGESYGRLTVIAEAERYCAPGGQSQRQVVCRCECGQMVTVRTASLQSGLTVSCGCRQREVAAMNGRNSATHGMEGTPTYNAWVSMKERCSNQHHAFYEHYGGRGICVCQLWRDSFVSFLADIGERPTNKHTLDRFPDNDGDYEPGNVRWATWKEQNRNRRNNALIEFQGETLCLAEWAERIAIHPDTLTKRLKQGWTIEKALTKTLKVQRNNRECSR